MECPKCGQAMVPINSQHNPAASEWWCKNDNTSEKMPEDVAATLNGQERMMAQAQPRRG